MLFFALESWLGDPNAPADEVIVTLEVLQAFLTFAPQAVRDYILQQRHHVVALGTEAPTGRVQAPRGLWPSDRAAREGGEHGTLVVCDPYGASLLQRIIWRLVDDPDVGVQQSAFEVLRSVFDFNSLLAHEKD